MFLLSLSWCHAEKLLHGGSSPIPRGANRTVGTFSRARAATREEPVAGAGPVPSEVVRWCQLPLGLLCPFAFVQALKEPKSLQLQSEVRIQRGK